MNSKHEINVREWLSLCIDWLGLFDFGVVQLKPQMLIYPQFRLLAIWVSQYQVVCRIKWMLWNPLFWVLAILVVQSSCFAINFPSRIFHSKYILILICPGLIWGTHQIETSVGLWYLHADYFRSWFTRYIVSRWNVGYICIACRSPLRNTYRCWTVIAGDYSSLRMAKWSVIVAYDSSILGVIEELWALDSTDRLILWCREWNQHVFQQC